MMERKKMMSGVSGIMRIKNDAEFIEKSVESCIDALDELIIVYNDCTDDSPLVIEQMRKKYPNKIKVFSYDYHVYAYNLSKEEYDYALNLPQNSPHLLSNYYNFALSKVSYDYALKIDADQFYFTEKLKWLCDCVRKKNTVHFSLRVLIGMLFFFYYKVFVKISHITGVSFYLLLSYMPQVLKRCYLSFINYSVKHDACISLSGLNLMCAEENVFVPLGLSSEKGNVIPPFNGVGDHLLFKVLPECHYELMICPEYNLLRNENYTLIERFVHPHKRIIGGFFWIHMNMMRKSKFQLTLELFKSNRTRFLPLSDFLHKSFRQIDKKTDKRVIKMCNRCYFQFCYLFDRSSLIKYSHFEIDNNEL